MDKIFHEIIQLYRLLGIDIARFVEISSDIFHLIAVCNHY